MYYILDLSNNNIVPMSFGTVEEAEKFGINSGWTKFVIIKQVKVVKV